VDTDLSDAQKTLRDRARAISQTSIAPSAAAIDRDARFPGAELECLARIGLLGVTVPKIHGGLGLATLDCALVLEEVASACASTATLMAQQNLLVCAPIARFGNEAQKATWLSALASGAKLGCFAHSDARAASVRAIREGDAWVLNGQKGFVLAARQAAVAIVLAATAEQDGDALSTFLVPTDVPGLTITNASARMGLRGTAAATMSLDRVRLPFGALLGREGQGREILEVALASGRIGDAAVAVGIADAAFAAATAHATSAVDDGKAVAPSQSVQFKLAEMASDIDAARLLTWRAAVTYDQSTSPGREAAMAKLIAGEVADRAAAHAVEVLGERGCLVELSVERYLRDAKTAGVQRGTNDSLRQGIASALLKD
jgi:butyryl-CoA dehydrogenase